MSSRLRHIVLGFGAEAATIASIQAVNYLAPLAALPFLSRGLGMTAFGVYAVAMVLSAYVATISDYSFSINGPLRLTQESGLPARERTLLAVSAAVRLGLAALCLPAAAAVLMWVSGADAWLVLVTCASFMATAATPRWAMYAQGRLKSFLLASALSRGLWLAGAIWIVKTPESLSPLLAWTAACQALLGAICWLILRPVRPPPLATLVSASHRLLRDDFRLFLSTTAVALVRDGAPFALSIFHGPVAMSLYAVSDRLRIAAIGLSAPLTQSLFLRRARSNSYDENDRTRAVANIAVLVPVALGCLILGLFAEPIVHVMAGPEYYPAAGVLQVLLLAPPLVSFNAIIGTNTLLMEGELASYSRAQLFSAAASVPLILILVYCFGVLGAAIATVVQEMVLAATLLWHLNKASLLGRAFPIRGANGNVER